MTLLIISFLLMVPFAFGHHEKYEGHQLYHIAGPAEDISSLEAKLDILSAIPAVRSTSGLLEIVARLSLEEKEVWLQYFEDRNMEYKKIADNLADILRDEQSKIEAAKSTAKRSGRTITWDTYYRYEEINQHLDEIAAQYPDLVTVTNANITHEGRQIKVLRISTTGFEDRSKPVIIIDAGMRGRDWVTVSVALYTIHKLVVDIADRQLTERLDWIIIPLLNPDGYEYSHTVDRLWSKTRSKSHIDSSSCPGVDINRNFNHRWGGMAANANPCASTYEGPFVFSEPESNVIRNLVWRHIDRASLYISLHSYGNMILYSWGSNGTVPANALSLHLAGTLMAEAIDELVLDKAFYTVGNAAQVLYTTTGESRDWARAAGVPLTYSLQISGYGYGVLVPQEYIEQIVTETWAGIATGAYYVLMMHNDCPFFNRKEQMYKNLSLKY